MASNSSGKYFSYFFIKLLLGIVYFDIGDLNHCIKVSDKYQITAYL